MALEVSEKCIYNRKARERLCMPTAEFSILYLIVEIIALMIILSTSGRLMVFLATTGIGLTAFLFSSMRRHRARLTREFAHFLQPQLEDRYGVSLAAASCVGIAPGRVSGQYLGDRIWDVGYLQLTDRLTYYGDQCSFCLDRSEIKAVRSCGRLHPNIEVEFIGPSGRSEWLMVEYRGSADRMEQLLEAQRLRAKIALLPEPAGQSSFPLPFLAGV